jgi:hypothetical protein
MCSQTKYLPTNFLDQLKKNKADTGLVGVGRGGVTVWQRREVGGKKFMGGFLGAGNFIFLQI